jgi:hypothetical protein
MKATPNASASKQNKRQKTRAHESAAMRDPVRKIICAKPG